MRLERIFDEQLAQASYLISCDHSRLGVVIDPPRNVACIIEAAANARVTIVAVTETHIHADFMSGSRELAKHTGAQLYLSGEGGPDWSYRFVEDSRAELLSDGSVFMVGDVKIEAVHTPGHTPEHMTFLVSDTSVGPEPMGACTGDFIFVGDVGRPDLLERAAGFAGTMEAGARTLFRSLQEFKKYPDYLQIWPGHGAGSACGKALGAMPQSTLGFEKLFNWGLSESDEENFVRSVLEGQPEPPAYFATMKRTNRDGPSDAPQDLPDVVDAGRIARALTNGAPVVDTRLTQEYAAGHASGTINIPRNRSFVNWCGSLLPYDREVYFIGDTSEEARRALRVDLASIGLENVGGVMAQYNIHELASRGFATKTIGQVEIDEVQSNRTATILDVRGRSEYQDGHLPGGLNIPLAELSRRLDEIPEGEVIVHCMGGSRSAIAASILERSGRSGVTNMTGGFTEWERSGNKVERGNGRN